MNRAKLYILDIFAHCEPNKFVNIWNLMYHLQLNLRSGANCVTLHTNQSAVATVTSIYFLNISIRQPLERKILLFPFIERLYGRVIYTLSVSDLFALTKAYYNSFLSNNSSVVWSQYYNCYTRRMSQLKIYLTQKILQHLLQDQLMEQLNLDELTVFFILRICTEIFHLLHLPTIRLNKLIPRSSEQECRQQIVSDLKQAQLLVNDNFLGRIVKI